MRLLMLGPPGAGKGTQSTMLSNHFGIPHLSAGELLRGEVSSGTDRGNRVKKYINNGDLVPPQEVVNIMIDEMFRVGREGFVVDGFPRDLSQYDMLRDFLLTTKNWIDKIFVLTIDEEEIVDRLIGRRVCSGCNKGYHVVHDKPIEEGICDYCNKFLRKRSDDDMETIQKRIETYLTKTKPLEKKIKYSKSCFSVDASNSKSTVFNSILEVLNAGKVEGGN